MSDLKIPVCQCVVEAQKKSVVWGIPPKYVFEGYGSSVNVEGPCYGVLTIKCFFCGAFLKTFDGYDFSRGIRIPSSV